MKQLWLLLVGFVGLGCKCDDDRPYTPYTVSVGPSTTGSVAPAPSGSVATSDAGTTFAARPSLLAPRASESWQLEGRALKAPANRVFERALVADFDGDGQSEVVAWTVKKDELLRAAAGELWLYPPAGAPRRLTELPGFVPTGPGCTLTSELTQTGPRTVSLDSEGKCQTPQLSRTPVRSLLVLAPAAQQPVVLGLRVADAAPGERLGFKLHTSDRDNDGQDDVALAVTLTADGTSRSGSATLGWFQRNRALREAGEPARSLARAAATEVVRAKSKKSAASAAEGVRNLRRLASSLCAESGTMRLLDADGAPLKCGDLGSFVDRSAEAEVQAALSGGDVLEAASVLERADWYFGKISSTQRSQLTRSIEKQCAIVAAVELTPPEVRPASRPAAPHFSPLAFQPSGALLVRTAQGVVRVSGDPPQEESLDVEAGIAAWTLDVLAPDGKRWNGVAHACDRSELMLTTSPTAAPLSTRLLASRPGPCNRAQPGPSSIVPIAWTSSGLRAVVAGSLITVPADAKPEAGAHPGSPYAPDGSRWVVATGLGLLVLGGERPELWRTGAPDAGPPNLGECVVSSGADRVACIEQSRVRWFKRP